ncbi:fimbria/pilus outer membrane usher protein [Microbulbifer thermotolerans]|uniref:fimbria/pilus outer membrane usher protein n=1 Tax=Microbulbifer thermotolerans TaxID=252514 RepID=UPI00224A8318|nr:fimbria/pilus outer membrane usher protein [Microbulbifer thermotolerans]MCX2783568.1 fimbria/pilus outer membrane usher protein [Microbulbifer thermotolerans]MCX2833788.1 fimbria/pilus outer membrane usher protein [Microbulbifer thermotolerans]
MASQPSFHFNNNICGRFAKFLYVSLFIGVVTVSVRADVLSDSPLLVANSAEHFLHSARLEQDLYLEAFYGEITTGLIVHARLSREKLYVIAGDLWEIGLQLPMQDPDQWVALDSVPGLSYRYDIPTQSLILHAPPNLRRAQHLGYQPPPPVEVRRDHGLLFSYDFYGREWQDSSNASLGTSLNWFGRYGSVKISGVSRSGDENIGYRRLDSFWTYSDPQQLWTWTAGDLISGGHSWNRPVRMGGVQWRRNFEVRPDLITLPVPRFDGSASLPSTVELYVNNILQYGANVDSGPFVLDALPRIGGAGMATLVVTDALGRATETSVPLYVDHRRLARGLSDFSIEAGVLRTNFEGGWDDYGEHPVASASWLQGITDTFTFEAHGELAEELKLAGIGGVWSPEGRWGLLSGSLAFSDGQNRNERDKSGHQYSLGYQWVGPIFGFDLQSLRRSRGYRDLADLDTDRTLIERWLNAQDRATLWLQTGRGSLAYSYLRWRDHRDRLLPREIFSSHSLSWTQNIGRRLSFSATLFKDDENGSGGSVTFSIPLQHLAYASVGVQRQSGGNNQPRAMLRHTVPYEGGWGWWLQGGNSDGDYGQAALETRGRYFEARAGIDWDSGKRGYFLEMGGSLAVMDGRVIASRRIQDAFALVYTGIGDVPVLSENRLYGYTDHEGYLLIPDLRGWQRNRIGINPDQLGANLAVAELEQFAVPADHAGQLIVFPIVQLRPAIITLLDQSGDAIAAGSIATLLPGGEGQTLPVGFDGELYLEDISGGARIEVQQGRLICHYHIDPGDGQSAPLTRLRLSPDICEELP